MKELIQIDALLRRNGVTSQGSQHLVTGTTGLHFLRSPSPAIIRDLGRLSVHLAPAALMMVF